MNPTCHPLASLRASVKLSHPAYAQLVAETHAALGFGQMAARREKISRWESGRATPELTAQLAMAHIHQVPQETIRHLGWPNWLNVAAESPAVLAHPWTTEHAVDALRIAASSGSRTSSSVAACGPRAARLADAWETALAGSPEPPVREGTPVTASDIAWMRIRLTELEEVSQTIPPAVFIQAAVSKLRVITGLLDSSGYTRETGTLLLRLGAWAANLCGELSHTLMDPASAERYFIAAVRSATAARAPAWASVSMSNLAFVHLDFGDPRDALGLNRAAQRAAPTPSPRHERLMRTREALILAQLGERTASARALDQAADTLFSGPHTEEPDLASNLKGADEEWLTIRAGMTYLRLGKYRTAIDYFAILLDDDPSLRQRSHHALPRELMEASDALLAIGDPGTAALLAGRAVKVNGTLPEGYVSRVRGEFAQYRYLPAARDLLGLLPDA
ncbi:hypothetical protein ACFWAR_01125 [Streptomyces sp. NPDC059917]|uniref:hypothetical protein n=1 Tax=Streptomyces sp. NPDC059917 TaxID=3347002 RepID=UPI00366326E7